jgi:hypothetical protein
VHRYQLLAAKKHMQTEGGSMKYGTLALALLFMAASAAFSACFAQTTAVSEKTFDWIFFAIVGIPFLLGFVVLFSESRGKPS